MPIGVGPVVPAVPMDPPMPTPGAPPVCTNPAPPPNPPPRPEPLGEGPAGVSGNGEEQPAPRATITVNVESLPCMGSSDGRRDASTVCPVPFHLGAEAAERKPQRPALQHFSIGPLSCAGLRRCEVDDKPSQFPDRGGDLERVVPSDRERPGGS